MKYANLHDYVDDENTKFTECPQCGYMSVSTNDSGKVECWHNETCRWKETAAETTEEHSVTIATDKHSGLSSQEYFVRMMGI